MKVLKRTCLMLCIFLMFGCQLQEQQTEELSAVKDTFATSVNVDLDVDGKAGVLSNDKNYNPDEAKVEFETKSENGGTISGAEDGSFTYSPPENFTGPDTFGYTLKESGKEVSAIVQVKVYGPLAGLGWIFMIASIAGVWALAIFCYKKLLFED